MKARRLAVNLFEETTVSQTYSIVILLFRISVDVIVHIILLLRINILIILWVITDVQLSSESLNTSLILASEIV